MTWSEWCKCVLLGGVVLAALGGCNRGQQQGMQMPPAAVITVPVSTADVPVYLDEIGKTTATAVVSVQPEVSGKILERYFKDGADVTAGQKLFTIDPTPFAASLHTAEAAVELAQAQLADAQTNFDRVSGLLASKAVAQQDYDDKKNAVAVGVATLKAAQAQVETAQWNLGNCTITSPISGRTGAALVDPGNVVSANTTALVNVQTIAPIYVDFTVPETELDRVRQNMAHGTLKVQVTSPVDLEHSVDGDLQFFDNAVQDGTGTIKLRAIVKNEAMQLWPGQFVQVRLILQTIHDAVLVPSEAVQVGQQGTYVFVVNSDDKTPPTVIAEQRLVTEGQRQGNQVVISDGLKPGDVIIRTGQLMVIPGMPVMVVNPPTTQPAATPVAAGDKS